jgi:CDP-paratose 2-epimerase
MFAYASIDAYLQRDTVKIFISGICGFVGSSLASGLKSMGHDVFGCDNFSRPGSALNLKFLKKRGVRVKEGDIALRRDLAWVKGAEWLIDAAAIPSVTAGLSGRCSSRKLMKCNLWGTINLLEICRRDGCGLIFLSTSRVYSVKDLLGLPIKTSETAFHLPPEYASSTASSLGITENFPTSPPVSLYGSTKLASETIALEYGECFGFPVLINRCGLVAGPGQFGRPDQGMFSYWINSWLHRCPLEYIGFGGRGLQVRDCLHPSDLLELISKQVGSLHSKSDRLGYNLNAAENRDCRVFNVGGGASSAMSLRQLSDWCSENMGAHRVSSSTAERRFDVPWVILDSSRAEKRWSWKPKKTVLDVCSEIAIHAKKNPNWLSVSCG